MNKMESIEYIPGNIGLYRLTNAALHKFCIDVLVKAGCMYEEKAQNGYAHLYEHMVFRHLQNRYGGAFYTLLARNGIDLNATTYPDCIIFKISGVKEGFSFACELLSHLFDDILIATEEFRKEKQRIKAEIREDEERTTLRFRCEQAIWAGTGLARTVHGYCANIDRASLSSVNRYKNEIVSEGNVFAVLTGSADEYDEALLTETLGKISLSKGEIKTNRTPLPADFLRRPCTLITQNDYYTKVFLSFDNGDPLTDKYRADLLSYVLAYGYDSLVSQALSENNPLIYDYDFWNSRFSNAGIFTLEYEVEPKNLEASLSLLTKCFQAIKTGRFDFETNRKKAITGYLLSLDNAYTKCGEIAMNLLLWDGDLDAVNSELQALRSIKKEEIMQLAQKVFVKDRMVLGVKGCKRKLDANADRLLRIFDEM